MFSLSPKTFLLLLALASSPNTAPKTSPQTSAPNSTAETNGGLRKIQLSDQQPTLTVRVGQSVVTSVRFNRALDKTQLVCGDHQSFAVALQGDRVLNLKATTEGHKTSNCNVITTGGSATVIHLVADEAHADAFVDVTFPDTAAGDAQTAKTGDSATDAEVFNAVRACQVRSMEELTHDAADAVISRHVDSRAVVWDVILIVHDFIKIGPRGLIRFSVDNRSRDAWAGGEVKLLAVSSGKDGIPLPVTTVFKTPVIDRGEEAFGAISFNMIDLPQNTRFSLQVVEKNGSRHPEVTGIRL